MKHNHDLIVKYLQLIQEQEQIINELSQSNKKLLNRNTELKNQKELYKQAASDWKNKYETLQTDVVRAIVETVPKSQILNAIAIYKQNQGE